MLEDGLWLLEVIMVPKADVCTFNQVQELLQMHENRLLNVFNGTIDRLDKNIDLLKEKNLKNQERIDRFEEKCRLPQC